MVLRCTPSDKNVSAVLGISGTTNNLASDLTGSDKSELLNAAAVSYLGPTPRRPHTMMATRYDGNSNENVNKKAVLSQR